MTHFLSLNITRKRDAVAVDGSNSTTSRSVHARGSLNSGKKGCPWSLNSASILVRSRVLTTAAPVMTRATATKIKVFHSSVIGGSFGSVSYNSFRIRAQVFAAEPGDPDEEAQDERWKRRDRGGHVSHAVADAARFLFRVGLRLADL